MRLAGLRVRCVCHLCGQGCSDTILCRERAWPVCVDYRANRRLPGGDRMKYAENSPYWDTTVHHQKSLKKKASLRFRTTLPRHRLCSQMALCRLTQKLLSSIVKSDMSKKPTYRVKLQLAQWHRVSCSQILYLLVRASVLGMSQVLSQWKKLHPNRLRLRKNKVNLI